jgi:hypothetical protein
MKAYGGIDIFLTSALAGGDWSASRPGLFTPDTHWIGGWVDPRAGLEDVESRKSCPYPDLNSDFSVVQPIASRYTDYAIPGSHNIIHILYNLWDP